MENIQVNIAMSIDEKVIQCQKEGNSPLRNNLIDEYTPFILNVLSKELKKYIHKENSEELLVGLEAFNDAIDKFSEGKGKFISFAEVVIKNRIKDYLRKENVYHLNYQPTKDIDLIGGDDFESTVILREEIQRFKNVLEGFGIDLEMLVEESPTHKKTRLENLELARNIVLNDEIVNTLYHKKKLPMSLIMLNYQTSKRKLKSHRNYLIALIIVYKENFDTIQSWIHEGGI